MHFLRMGNPHRDAENKRDSILPIESKKRLLARQLEVIIEKTDSQGTQWYETVPFHNNAIPPLRNESKVRKTGR